MKGLWTLLIPALIGAILVAVSIYEAVVATQLSLPTAPLTIPTIFLPLLALANALHAHRTVRAPRHQGNGRPGATTTTTIATREGPPPASLLVATALQVLQGVLATALTTLLLSSSGLTDLSSSLCGLEAAWQRMYSAHDGDAIRRVQDALACCGFNTPRDRAWPFPRRGGGGGDGGGRPQHDACEVMWEGRVACRVPWADAMRWSAGVGVGVVLVVAGFQVVTLLVISGSIRPSRGASWTSSLFGRRGRDVQRVDHQQQLPPSQYARGLLAAGETYRDDVEGNGEAGEGDTAGGGHDGGEERRLHQPRAIDQAQGPRLEPSMLLGEARNEWRDG